MGNYVIAGGDFNHDIADTAEAFPTERKLPGWVYRLTDEDLSEELSFVIPENSRGGAELPGRTSPMRRASTTVTLWTASSSPTTCRPPAAWWTTTSPGRIISRFR